MLMIYGLKLDSKNSFAGYTKLGDQKLYVRGFFDDIIVAGNLKINVTDIELELVSAQWVTLTPKMVDLEELEDALLIRVESRNSSEDDKFTYQRYGRKLE